MDLSSSLTVYYHSCYSGVYCGRAYNPGKVKRSCQHTLCTAGPSRVQCQTAGSIVYIRCYRTWASAEVQEQIWKLSEYVHAYSVSGVCEFYIREDKLSWALLIDPLMTPVRDKDFVE